MDSAASAKFIHQSQNVLAELEQFLSRPGNQCLRQELLWRDGFQSSLTLMQMVQRAF